MTVILSLIVICNVTSMDLMIIVYECVTFQFIVLIHKKSYAIDIIIIQTRVFLTLHLK